MSPTLLDPEFYVWKQTSTSPLTYRRPVLALESTWAATRKPMRDIFVSCKISLHLPSLTTSSLTEKAKAAWRELHHEVPELRVKAVWENDKGFMQWAVPEDERETEITFSVIEESTTKLSFESLRLSMLRKGEADAFLVFHPRTNLDGSGLVTGAQMMIYVDHLITDGIGARILLGKYLALLTEILKGDAREDIEWTRGREMLSKPWILCLKGEPGFEGNDFEDTAKLNRKLLSEEMKENPGLPYRQDETFGTQETYFITLPADESRNLLQAIKSKIGSGSNITHLGHAATVLALLRSTSASLTATTTLYSPCWLNGRRYLAIPGSATMYIPQCMGFAPISFAGLPDLLITTESSDDDVREKLTVVCRLTTREYGKIRMTNSGVFLGACVKMWEEWGETMMKTLLKPPAQNDGPEKEATLADPYFLSDGVTEQYISRSYPTSSQSPILTVDDVHFAAAADKNIIVRMSSWRDQIRISGEWSCSDYERDYVVGFLEDVNAIMRLLVA